MKNTLKYVGQQLANGALFTIGGVIAFLIVLQWTPAMDITARAVQQAVVDTAVETAKDIALRLEVGGKIFARIVDESDNSDLDSILLNCGDTPVADCRTYMQYLLEYLDAPLDSPEQEKAFATVKKFADELVRDGKAQRGTPDDATKSQEE